MSRAARTAVRGHSGGPVVPGSPKRWMSQGAPNAMLTAPTGPAIQMSSASSTFPMIATTIPTMALTISTAVASQATNLTRSRYPHHARETFWFARPVDSQHGGLFLPARRRATRRCCTHNSKGHRRYQLCGLGRPGRQVHGRLSRDVREQLQTTVCTDQGGADFVRQRVIRLRVRRGAAGSCDE